jgi:hypothetical protein
MQDAELYHHRSDIGKPETYKTKAEGRKIK